MNKQTTAKKTTEAPVKVTEDKRVPMAKVIEGLPTTSAKIRALAVAQYTRSETAKFLGKRYQHVRNVLITPLKTAAPAQASK